MKVIGKRLTARCLPLAKTAVLASTISLSSVFADGLPDFTALIKNNAPAVVQITAQRDSKLRDGFTRQPMTPDQLFRYFFGNPDGLFDNPGGFSNRQPVKPRRALGSGFFISNDGYIITNAHVIRDADKIIVSTTDQKEYDAKLVGSDKRTDIALLKIKDKGNKQVEIGDSDKVKVGQWVVAIGNPFGFDYTATTGIISAVSRSLPDGTYVPFLQTDAAVNPGNSGGPLFDLQGRVIGVNSQIYSNTGSFNGLAFAIPINTAMNIAQQLKKNGKVSHGWLGVGIQTVNQDLATSFGLDKPTGALVSSVMKGSPAEKAGIKTGDIILSFNGREINKSSALAPLVGSLPAGTKAQMQVLRKGKRKTLNVTLADLDNMDKPIQLADANGNASIKGLHVDNLSIQQKRALSVDSGVVISAIDDRSKAQQAGFRVGDVIISINNRKITSVDDFIKIMNGIGDKPVAVLVIRQGNGIFIPL